MKKLVILTLALSMAFAGCSKVSPTGETLANGRVNAFTKPHVLRYATAGDINTLNPHFGQQATLGDLSSMTMGYLIKWDENNNPYPELATQVPTQANGGVSKDGLTITFHIRKGVVWSDGAPFNADDVVFSTNVVLNPANNEISRTGWDRIKKIDEPDKYTVIYHLTKPYSPFIEVFFSSAGANPCLLPKHLLAQYPNLNHVAYNSLPVGIGPFMYKRWDRTQDVIMVANPKYWRGAPKLHEVDFEIVPDRNTVLSELEAKELDMWYAMSGSYYDRVASLQPFTIINTPGYIYNHYDFNITHPVVSDVTVRRALRLATDRVTLLAKIEHGLGVLQETTTPKTAPYYTEQPLVPFDIAQANAMLDKDGWVRGADGIRVKNGVRLELTVATTSGTPDTDNRIEIIREGWKEVGAAMNVRHYPAALFFEPLDQGGIVYGNSWDMIFFAWTNDAIGDTSGLYSCKSFPPAGQNDPHWCNPKAEAAYSTLYSHYDQSARNKDIAIIEKELVNDVPTVVFDMRAQLTAVNKDLKNFHPNGVSPFDNMMDVDI
jgi:peptide/nickel transport system substrate-binding protein